MFADAVGDDGVVVDAGGCGEVELVPDLAADGFGYERGGGEIRLVFRDVEVGFVER